MSVPLKEACVIIVDMLSKDIEFSTQTKLSLLDTKSLIDLCLSRCYFLWENEIHELKNTGPIGLSIMVVIAEAFLQYHEARAIHQALSFNPPIVIKSFYRYVDDSHARFKDNLEAKSFLTILNNQDKHIQYTIEVESAEKSLNFLDLTIHNNKNGKYEFEIHRKNAITNVQIKPNSNHDPKIQLGVFKGFISRAFNLCSEKYLDQELEFLLNVFVENGYQKKSLLNIISSYKRNHKPNINRINDQRMDLDNKNRVTLPWIPNLSCKLKKDFKKAGFDLVFKSGNNIEKLPTAMNKIKLPYNSYPGIYRPVCSCGQPYNGETKMKISTRIDQHKLETEKGNWQYSGITEHSQKCHGCFQWQKKCNS